MSNIIDFYLERLAVDTVRRGLPREVIEAAARAANEAIRSRGKNYRLHHDFETYCDVSVTDVGSDVYSRHPSTEVLMAAYACDDEAVLQWVPAEGQEMPRDLREMMLDPNAIKFAWNKPFEWAIWAHVLGIFVPHHLWRDPMVMAYAASLPGSLGKAGEVVGLPEDIQKSRRGKALIKKFCAPRKPTKGNPATRLYWSDAPDDWEEFKDYNRTDVEAERGIYKRLKPFDLPATEWDLWVLDQEINQAGIPINMRMVNNAIEIYEDLMDEVKDEMKALTGLANPGSTAQLLGWLKERGYPYDDLKAGHVVRGEALATTQLAKDGITLKQADDIADTIGDVMRAGGEWLWTEEWHEVAVIRRVLYLRIRAAKASPKKYYALVDYCDRSDPANVVIRNAFQFAGAGRTWRWSGRSFQAQNLPRPANKMIEKAILLAAKHIERLYAPAIKQLWPDAFDVLTSCIRPVAQAPDGYLLIDADLNAIENRVLGWIAKCKKILRVFELDRDPYIDFATYLFGGSYEQRWAEYKAGDSSKRTTSKPGVLGCGYMLGAGEVKINKKTGEEEGTGLLGYAWNMGVRDFTKIQSKLSVDTFRREFEEVTDFWYAIERTMKKCIRTGLPQRHHMVKFDMKAPFLRMILPSGRALHYCRPRLEVKRMPWGKEKEVITYEGLNDKKQWIRIQTHPGKITENADQAISRDIIARGMRIAAREYKIDIRIHVHDQIVGLVREEEAQERLEQLQEAMSREINWAPGLPLGSAGFVSKIFVKD